MTSKQRYEKRQEILKPVLDEYWNFVVKPFVIGRKNWLFSDTDKGADASARCYSIIESANHNDLNVFGYLSYLLTELPKLGENPSDEQLDCLMPWSETLPRYCKNV